MEHDLRTNFSFSVDEHKALMQIFQQSLSIRGPSEMFSWLHGDLQQFIPHETLISARGDIKGGNLALAVISALPALQGNPTPSKEVALFAQSCFDRWKENRYHPLVIRASNGFLASEDDASEGSVLRSLRRMRSVIVHGIEGARGESDRMYMAFHSDTQNDPMAARRMTELIMPFIDVTMRRLARSDGLAEFRINLGTRPADDFDAVNKDTFGLSAREMEIMKWVRYGKTNQEIGMILSISIFTVKNHLRHVFEKLNVVNRAQAVAKLVTPQENLRANAF
jgi:transcriptional regulator EpsA